jgi:hypothetical protein
MQKKAIPMRKCYEMLKFEKFKFTWCLSMQTFMYPES